MFGSFFSKSKDSQNIADTNMQNQVTDWDLKRKKYVTCPKDDKYRESVDYAWDTPEACSKARRDLAELMEKVKMLPPPRDLAKEARDQRAEELRGIAIARQFTQNQGYTNKNRALQSVTSSGLKDAWGRDAIAYGGKRKRRTKARKSRGGRANKKTNRRRRR
jgi:hypothetical protein